MTSVAHVTRNCAITHSHAPAHKHQHLPARHATVSAFRASRHASTAFVGSPRTALPDMTVQERFATLQDRFDPSTVKGVDVRFQFDISGPGGGKWYCTIKDQKLTVVTGTGPNPTATLHASSSDYLKIANGKMNKMWALVQGKLKVEGDTGALKKWDTYFKS